MIVLLAGLLLFLGVHALPIVADGWRLRFRETHGEGAWKGLFSLAAAAGLVLIVWGYGLTRLEPLTLWNPPQWTRPAAALLTLAAFILVAAAYVPRNHLKAKLGHPMYAGIKAWAFAHLIANGRLADLILFGAFLVWSVAGFASARRRDRRAGIHHPPGTPAGTLLTLAAGLLAWVFFALYLHRLLIGVGPL